MRKSSGQSAMEYLMTYGWAILVVIAVVAALYGLGVFRIGSSGVTCSPCFSYFAYIDYTGGTLKIRNGPNEISSIAAASPGGASVAPTTATAGQTVNVTGIPTTGAVNVTLTYTVTASGLVHSDSATLNQ